MARDSPHRQVTNRVSGDRSRNGAARANSSVGARRAVPAPSRVVRFAVSVVDNLHFTRKAIEVRSTGARRGHGTPCPYCGKLICRPFLPTIVFETGRRGRIPQYGHGVPCPQPRQIDLPSCPSGDRSRTGAAGRIPRRVCRQGTAFRFVVRNLQLGLLLDEEERRRVQGYPDVRYIRVVVILEQRQLDSAAGLLHRQDQVEAVLEARQRLRYAALVF